MMLNRALRVTILAILAITAIGMITPLAAERDFDSLFKDAESSVKAGRYEEAIAILTIIITAHPEAAEAYINRGTAAVAYLNRGNIWSALQDHVKAIADFSSVIRIYPRSHIAYTNRGNSHITLRQFDHALADFDKAISLNPTYALAYLGRGIVHKEKGDLDKAAKDFNDALFLDPEGVRPAFKVKDE